MKILNLYAGIGYDIKYYATNNIIVGQKGVSNE